MKAFARSIIETVRHPLLILDREFRIVAANGPFYHTFDTTPVDGEGRSLFDLDNHRWDSPPLRAALDGVVGRGGTVEDLEIAREVPRLGLRILAVNARQVQRDDDDVPMLFLGVEDVTERRRAADELQALNVELERRVAERTAELVATNRELAASNRELEAFCYSVSHDLRAPLRAVDGFSQELADTCADRLDEQARHYLRRVRNGVQRMGQLIDDLLKLSRVSRTELTRERVDLSALAAAVAAECRQREPGRSVTFVVQPGLVADCDPRLVRVVLDNLIGNAWKFTAKAPAARIEFGQSATSPPTFYVRDDGAGFDMAYQTKLFGAFQRLHTDRDFPGTGIGLATVQRIVRKHGGEVWAEGAVGRGATFSFTLSTPKAPS